jgi:hypothetical protein
LRAWSNRGYDHLALVAEGADPEARHQREAGVEIDPKLYEG